MSQYFHIILVIVAGCAAAPLKEDIQANITAVSAMAASLNGTLTEIEDPEEVDSDFKKSVHLSTALAGMVLLLFLQFHINSHGYRLGRAFWASSGNFMWVGMGVIGGLWTMLVFLSAWKWEATTPCMDDPGGSKTFARIREMEPFNYWIEPVIVYVVLLVPVMWTSVGALKNSLYTLGMLSLAAGILLFHTLQDYPFHLDLPHRYHMDDIRMALPTKLEYGIVYVLPSRWHGFEAVYSPRIDSEHADIEAQRHFFEPLDSVLDDKDSNEQWTLQKCRNAIRRTIDARIRVIEEDEKMLTDLALWLYCERLVPPDDVKPEQEPKKIRKWRYSPLMTRGSVRRDDARTLVGRDVAMALLLWETLVFYWRYNLYEPKDNREGKKDRIKTTPLRERVWRLRDPRYYGRNYNVDGLTETTTNLPSPAASLGTKTMGKYREDHPLGGLLEAVGEVYRLLGDPDNDPQTKYQARNSTNDNPRRKAGMAVEKTKANENSELVGIGRNEMINFLLSFHGKPLPQRSVLPGVIPESMTVEEYAKRVWQQCWEAYPCTFGALCLWTTVWYFDMGNDKGLHTTPLVPAGELKGFPTYGPDYMSTWRMQWRHTWHTALVCQLVIMLPTVVSTFFSLMPMG
ncbi:hypothetical protein QBC47DRAFT_406285 [Echria macrotheca]|uniref:Uncharacterized protein n=1 Tax=Echria macrotheca TaxID=438768 RepID=A0AAJ0B6E0_9PEZI|nr:hypothetical protein QBC47DRAFT_406285 [Echria macrotheca]